MTSKLSIPGILVMCLACTLSLAQSLPFPSNVNVKKLKDIDVLMTNDYVFAVGEMIGMTNILGIVALNKTTQKSQSFLTTSPSAILVGYREAGDNIDIYMRMGKTLSLDPKITCIRFSKATGEFGKRHDVTTQFDPNEATLIVTEDGAVCMEYSSKDETLIILKDDGENTSVINKIPVPEKNIRELVSYTTSANSFNTDLEQAYYRTKWYHRNGLLLLTNDAYDGKENAGIGILSINPADGKIKHEILNLDYDKSTDHNSFLFGDQLFVFSNGKEGLSFETQFLALDIYDIKTLSKIKGGKHGNNQFFPLRAGGYYRNSKTFPIESISTQGTLEGIGRAARLFTTNILTINVNTASDSLLELSLGTYKIPTGGHVVTTAGAPGNGTSSSSIIPGNSSETRLFVVGLMNKTSLEPVNNQLKLSNTEERKIKWLEGTGKKVKTKRAAMVRCNGHAYMVYADANKNTIEIDELK